MEHATSNKAGYPKKSGRCGQKPLFPGACSLPNPRSTSLGAKARSLEEARLKRDARALHEVDRRERDAKKEKSYASTGASSVAREVRERRFSDFDDDESDVVDEDITCFNREWWRRCCRIFTPSCETYLPCAREYHGYRAVERAQHR